jgi:pimeloyl-ACP methyl ester carboxylesterase
MIHYQYYPLVNKPCLLFLHGWGVDSSYLKCFISPFKQDFALLFIDLPGMGKSPLDGVYQLDDYVHQVFQIVNRVNPLEVIGIGHSFGGKILAQYALKYPLKGMILLAPSIIRPRNHLTIRGKIFCYKLLKKLKIKIPYCLRGSPSYQKLDPLMKMTFSHVCRKYFSKKELSRIKVKTYIIGFDQDEEIKPYMVKKIHRGIKNSLLFIYEGNHFGYLKHIKEMRTLVEMISHD